MTILKATTGGTDENIRNLITDTENLSHKNKNFDIDDIDAFTSEIGHQTKTKKIIDNGKIKQVLK